MKKSRLLGAPVYYPLQQHQSSLSGGWDLRQSDSTQ